jgi:hypothetical protein
MRWAVVAGAVVVVAEEAVAAEEAAAEEEVAVVAAFRVPPVAVAAVVAFRGLPAAGGAAAVISPALPAAGVAEIFHAPQAVAAAAGISPGHRVAATGPRNCRLAGQAGEYRPVGEIGHPSAAVAVVSRNFLPAIDPAVEIGPPSCHQGIAPEVEI